MAKKLFPGQDYPCILPDGSLQLSNAEIVVTSPETEGTQKRIKRVEWNGDTNRLKVVYED